MKTIEERAKEYSLKDFDGYYTGREKAMKEGYIAGATEQKAIDEEVRLKKCDDMTEAEYEREAAFAEWYSKNGKGTQHSPMLLSGQGKRLLKRLASGLVITLWK